MNSRWDYAANAVLSPPPRARSAWRGGVGGGGGLRNFDADMGNARRAPPPPTPPHRCAGGGEQMPCANFGGSPGAVGGGARQSAAWIALQCATRLCFDMRHSLSGVSMS